MTGRQKAGVAVVAALTGLLTVRFLFGASDSAFFARGNACRTLEPDPLSPRLRGAAPDFELSDMTGKTWSLSRLRGRPVLVSFWATWCPPCVDEIPSLEALARRLGDRATVLAVSVDEDWDAIRRFFPKGTPLTVLLDPSKEVPARWGTTKFPETFLVGANGQVEQAFINKRDWSSSEAASCVADAP
jgi:thiol-disulfide isomerase/thioredoxin